MKGEKVYRILPLDKWTKGYNIDRTVLICEEKYLPEEIHSGDDFIIGELKTSVEKLKSVNYNIPVFNLSFAAVTDYEWYQKYQSNSESTILSIINDADDLFEFECNIKISIENIDIYTSSDDPFTVDFSNGSALLSELASYWDTSHSGTYVNVVCLFSNKSCPSCNYRGWAVRPGQFSAIRDGYYNYKILAHEIGHNLGANHDDAYTGSPTSIMYAHLNLPENNFWLTSANKSNISNEINNRLITYSYFEDDALCGNTTFSVSNIPSSFTVTWPKSSTLGFGGGSTGSPITIVPVSNGASWVEPTLTRGSQVIKFPKDEFWAGDPITPTQIIPFWSNGMEFGSDSYYNFRVIPNQSVSYYNWDVDGGTITEGQGTPWITVRTLEVPGEYNINFGVAVRTENTCGESSWFVRTGWVIPGTGGATMVCTPNPTSGETILSIETDSEEETFDETAP